MGFNRTLLTICGLAVLLAGCATPPPESDKEALAEYRQTNDPGEPTNRAIFAVNKGLDDYAIKPVAKGYQHIPSPVRKSIRSFLTNMHEPWTFLNEVMQGEIKRSGVTLGRFCVNTTAGLLGLFDLMDNKLGPAHEEDFGQTLAVWGVGEGPFVTLPLLGPSNPRDAVGTAVGYLADPAGLALALVVPPYGMAGITVVGGIDKREKYLKELDEVERTSLDYYASLRSLYRQKRAKDIGNGKNVPLPIDYGLDDDPQPAVSSKPFPVTVTPGGYVGDGATPSSSPAKSIDEEQRQMDELIKSMRAKASGLKS